MTTIPVNDKWRIELDEYSWAVAHHAPRKNKSRKQWQQVSWHMTLEQAAQSLAERLLSDAEAHALGEVLSAQREGFALMAGAIQMSGISNSWLDQKNRIASQRGAQ
jgi:hypothetical protein